MHDRIRRYAAANPDKTLFTFVSADAPDRHISAGRLQADMAAQAAAWQLPPGAVVALAFDHGYPLVGAFFAVMAAGAVPCILPYFRPDMSAADYAARVGPHLAALHRPVVLTTAERQADLDQALAPPRNAPTSNAAYIQLSSGTTATPKAIPIFADQLDHYLAITAGALAMTPQDVAVGWLPLYHDMGLVTQLLQPLYGAGHSVLLDPADWLRDPARLFRATADYGGSVTWMPNFALGYCRRRVDPAAFAAGTLSSMRILGCGAEPVQVETLTDFADTFAAIGLRRDSLTVAYGMAENVAGISLTPPGTFPPVDWVDEKGLQTNVACQSAAAAPGSRAVVSCGRLKPTLQLRIVDESGADRGPRQVGEIWLRGPSLFRGYFQAGANGAADGGAVDDGWFQTGDIGYCVDDQLYLCGRKNDLIISAGRNISPDRLEQIAAAELGAAGRYVVAFGVYDDALGTDTVVLICEMRSAPDAAARADWLPRLRRRLQRDMDLVPADIQLVPRGWIPKTTSGKISRTASRTRYLETGNAADPIDLSHLWRQGPPLAAELSGALQAWCTRATGASFTADDDFFDRGGSSLDFLGLILALETAAGRKLPLHQLIQKPTPAQMAAATIAGDRPPAPDVQDRPAPLARPRRPLYDLRGRAIHFANFGPRWGGAGPDYEPGLVWLSRFARLLRRGGAFRKHRQALRQLAAALPEVDVTELTQQSFELNLWRGWRLRQLADPAVRARWLTVSGGEYLAAAQAAGQGLLLVHAHTALMGMVSHLQSAWAPAGTFTVGRIPPGARSHEASWRRLAAGQLLTAADRLRHGGLVHIAGDGRLVTGGFERPFLNRRRLFGSGFAELARQTGAVVLTTVVLVAPTGRVEVNLQPLPTTSNNSADMVDAYVAWLLDIWRRSPANITWQHLQDFTTRPRL